jgi:PAS domain S-box-containing protein
MIDGCSIAREVVENVPVGVIVVDGAMRVVYVNPTAEEIVGCVSAELVGRHLSEVLDAQLWDEGSALRQAVDTGRRVEPRVTTEARNRSGGAESESHAKESQFLVGAAPIDGGYLLSLQRASAFHQIEANTVSDLAHDIRGPLASIRAYTELLIDEVDAGQPALRQQFLRVIDERTRHLTRLVVNLTGLVRWRLGQFQVAKMDVSLRDVAARVIADLRDQAEQGDVRLILDAAGNVHPILGDPDALSVLLKNLIDNAIRFSHAGQEVVVSLRRESEHQSVKVMDRGRGIPPDDLPRIFEPFYRGRNAIAAGLEGTGLGLAMARVIVEAHDGKLRLESEEGKGTSVTARLPAAENCLTQSPGQT